MSERAAKVYTNTSRRASHKQSIDRRPVYKSVLANPFHVDCPTVSSSLQQSILTRLTALFDGVAAHYQLARNTQKEAHVNMATSASHEQTESYVDETNQELLHQSPSPPPIISHMRAGINSVTKVLEREVRSGRQTVITPGTAVDQKQFLTRVIFICHADLDTPALVAHLPQLVALCNSARSEDAIIKVVQLPAGASTALANVLGYLKRVSVLALDDLTPGLGQLEPLLATVPDPPASWIRSIRGVALEPSHVKQLLTTAPKDMRAAKERRAKGRAAAKEKKWITSSLPHGDPAT
ncbi:hypothetical protein F5148DRAFT_973309 [Russula earlei]|uniref:Uncharacterized protein n=1 Tax=Russula earlei TaxID=71964 RepID=A0ACC0ULM9_9AGAM|nr:hypothetical protein F5148DRAFT_973309 [Russula earlei]